MTSQSSEKQNLVTRKIVIKSIDRNLNGEKCSHVPIVLVEAVVVVVVVVIVTAAARNQ